MDSLWKHKYSAKDSSKISDIVNYLKAQGIFDQFRHDCLSDVDTKPSYQNLSQRVDGNATKFLSNEEWNPDLNKNEFRNKLRRHIEESGMVSSGVDHVVDQVVNPKIFQIFMPKIREIVQQQLAPKQPKEEDVRKDIRSIKPDPDAEPATSRSRVYGIFSKTSNAGHDILHSESSDSDFLTKLTKSETSTPSKADSKIIADIKVRESPDLQSPKQRFLNAEREKKVTSSIKVSNIKKEIDFEKESKFTNIGHSASQLQKPLEKKKPVNDGKIKSESYTPTKEKNPSSSLSVAKKNDASKHTDGKHKDDASKHTDGKYKDDASKHTDGKHKDDASKHDEGKSKDDSNKASEGKSKDLKASDSKLTSDHTQKKSEVTKPVKLERTESSDRLKDKKKEKLKEEIKTKYKSSSAIAPREKSQDSFKSSSSSKHKSHDSQKYKSSDSDKSETKHKDSHHHHHDSQARDKHATPDKNRSSSKDTVDSKGRSSSRNKLSSSNEPLKTKSKTSTAQEEKSKSKDNTLSEISGSSKYSSKDSPTKKLQTSVHRDRHEKSTHSSSSERKSSMSGDGKHESKHSTHSSQERKKSVEKSKSQHSHSEKNKSNDVMRKSRSLESQLEKSRPFDLHTEKDKAHSSHSEKSKPKEYHLEKGKSHQSRNERQKSHDSRQEKKKAHERSSDTKKIEQQRSERSKSPSKVQVSSERSKSLDSNSETNKTQDRINFKDLKFEKDKSKQTSTIKEVQSNKNLTGKSVKDSTKKTLAKSESTSSSSSSSILSSPYTAAVSSKSSVDSFSDVETNPLKSDAVKKEKTSSKDEKKHKILSKPLPSSEESSHDTMQLLEMEELSQKSYNETFFPKEFEKPEESPVHYQDPMNVQNETYDDLAMLATSSPSDEEISVSDGEIKSVEDGSNSQQSKSFPLEQAALIVQKAGIVICSDEQSVSEVSSINESEQDNTESKDYKLRTRSKILGKENKSTSSNSQRQTTRKNASQKREPSPPKSAVRSLRKTRSTSSSDSGKVEKQAASSSSSSSKKDDENSVDDDSSHSSNFPVKKREFRRERKLNPKYASSDYASIFNSCKKGSGKTVLKVENSVDEKMKESAKNDDEEKEEEEEDDDESGSSSESSDSSSSENDEESSVESENESHHSSQHSSQSTKRKLRSDPTSSENEASDDSDIQVRPSRRSKRLRTAEEPSEQTEDKIITKTSKSKSKQDSDESSEEQTEKRESKRISRMKAPPVKPNASKVSKASINNPKIEKVIENRRRSSRDSSRSNDKTVSSIKPIEKVSEKKRPRNASETQSPIPKKRRRKSKEQITVDRSKNNGYKTQKGQRYDSSDLYKPRPMIQSSTRRGRVHTPPL